MDVTAHTLGRMRDAPLFLILDFRCAFIQLLAYSCFCVNFVWDLSEPHAAGGRDGAHAGTHAGRTTVPHPGL